MIFFLQALMKTRRDEMRNIWCTDSTKSFEKQPLPSPAYLPPYSTSPSFPANYATAAPNFAAASPNFAAVGHHGFSLTPLNIIEKDDLIESRDSESPISDVEITS